MKVLGLDLSLTASGAVVVVDGVAAERWLLKTNGDHSDLERCDYIATETLKVSSPAGIRSRPPSTWWRWRACTRRATS